MLTPSSAGRCAASTPKLAARLAHHDPRSHLNAIDERLATTSEEHPRSRRLAFSRLAS